MNERYICEAVWHGEAGIVATRQWPLTATDKQAAIEEMLGLYTSESESVGTGKGVGTCSFMLKQATEDEWRALREVS